MNGYVVHELPDIDDPDLVRCCVAVQGMRNTLLALTKHIIAQFGSVPVTTANRVALALLQRMHEGSLSMELLCLKNRVRDAAIILLSLIEVRLDLQYIAMDLTRAGTWIDHTVEGRKPWSVRSEFEALYTDRNELDAELAVYRQYSMAKHCNPAGLSFSFPVAVTRDTLQLDLATTNNQSIITHLFGLAICIHRAGEAASRILSAHGLDVGAFVGELKKGCDMVSGYNGQYILAMLKAWQRARDEKHGT